MEIIGWILGLPFAIVAYAFAYTFFYPAVAVALACTCAKKLYNGDKASSWAKVLTAFVVVLFMGLVFGMVGGFIASLIMIFLTMLLGGVTWLIGTYVLFCAWAIGMSLVG